MRYPPEQKTRTRDRIVRNAARKLRVEGLTGPSVASIMKASGCSVASARSRIPEFQIAVARVAVKFIESEMDDIVVMNFLGSHIVTKFKPNTVEQVDFFGRKTGRMRTEIKNMLLPTWEENFQHQLRFRIRQTFPGEAGSTGFFSHR